MDQIERTFSTGFSGHFSGHFKQPALEIHTQSPSFCLSGPDPHVNASPIHWVMFESSLDWTDTMRAQGTLSNIISKHYFLKDCYILHITLRALRALCRLTPVLSPQHLRQLSPVMIPII